MCTMVYVGSDVDLGMPTASGHPVIAGSLNDDDRVVGRLFSTPIVEYVVAFGGCGCCFNYNVDQLEGPAPDGYESSRQSLRDLRRYIETGLKSGRVEVYSCWDGDWGLEPEARTQVTPEYFDGESFTFEERLFLTVVPQITTT